MVRAAVSGAIDFSQADPLDRWWRQKLGWVLTEMTRQNNEQMLADTHRHYVTLVSNSSLKSESFDRLQELATEALQQLRESRYPWLPKTGAADDVRDMWQAMWGDPRDPKWQDPRSFYWGEGEF